MFIEPLQSPEYDLDELVSQITQDNLPDPVDTGTPVGSEVW
jgi:antitoxin component of MazEF toxin-antitoxin module